MANRKEDTNSEYYKWGTLRRQAQERGEIPEWMTTIGYITFQNKYLYEADHYKAQVERIANTIGAHADRMYGDYKGESWKKHFFDVIWKGWLGPSTPVYMNTGTDRGCSVSCSGGYTPDSIAGFFDTAKEVALLSKNGFGTSAYLGDIRDRGQLFGKDGHADGMVPVATQMARAVEQVRQPGRRGSGAWYDKLGGGDFWEMSSTLKENPDLYNIGWNVTDDFLKRLEKGEKEASDRFARSLKNKLITGKGYYFFPDKANRNAPGPIKDSGITIKNSNLCTEIMLPCDEDYTFTCVLSSMNLAKFDEWVDTDAVFISTVFLDGVAEDFIETSRDIIGLEKAVKFTEDFRALGLGVLGFHTYLQDNMIAIEEFGAISQNARMFKHLDEQTLKASKYMASIAGSPKFCEGHDVRNATRIACAPTMTNALICGSVSNGIEPFYMGAYTFESAAGNLLRINPSLVRLLKDKDKYTDDIIKSIRQNAGSVQHLEELNDEEKLVFRTAFEINQSVLIRLAAQRQKWIDQGQSLNLFYSADEDEMVIARHHKEAFLNENILALYYIRSEKGVPASSGECVMCEG